MVEEGARAVRNTAREISQRFPQSRKKIALVSSPAPRAMGTAFHVVKIWNPDHQWGEGSANVEPLLRPILIRNREAVNAHYREVVGERKNTIHAHRLWDSYFMRSPAYQEGKICEPLSSAYMRLIQFLGSLPDRYGMRYHVVAVTHLELVGMLVHEVFQLHNDPNDDHLRPSEVVHISLRDDETALIEFRGEVKEFAIKIPGGAP